MNHTITLLSTNSRGCTYQARPAAWKLVEHGFLRKKCLLMKTKWLLNHKPMTFEMSSGFTSKSLPTILKQLQRSFSLFNLFVIHICFFHSFKGCQWKQYSCMRMPNSWHRTASSTAHDIPTSRQVISKLYRCYYFKVRHSYTRNI